MKYLRVEIPVLQIKSLRHAEEGEELAVSVYSRDDKLLAENGDDVSGDDLKRFKNFNVRSLTVYGFQERWVPGDREANLPPRAEIIERSDFADAIAEIVDSLHGRESLEYIVDMTQYLRRIAIRFGRDDRVQELENLTEKAMSVGEKYDELLDKLEDVDDEQAKERIEEVLFDSSASTDDSFMDLPVDQNLLQDVVKASNQRLRVIAPLVDIANDLADEMGIDRQDIAIEVPPFPEQYHEAIRRFNAGEIHDAIEELPETGSEDWKAEIHRSLTKEHQRTDELLETVDNLLGTPVCSTIKQAITGEESINPKILDTLIPDDPGLASDISDLLEDRVDNRDQLWDKLNDKFSGIFSDNTEKHIFMAVTELPPQTRQKEVLPEKEALAEARELKEVGQYLDAVQQLLQSIRDRGGGRTDLEGELMVFGEEFENLLSRREQLESKIEQEVDNAEQQKMLMTLLNERQDYEPDHLLNIDVSMILLEEIDSYKTREMDKLEQFDQYFEQLFERKAA